jgi:hypothetical protein
VSPFAAAGEEAKRIGLPYCVPFAVAEAADEDAEQIARKREKSRRGWEGEESAKAKEEEEGKQGTDRVFVLVGAQDLTSVYLVRPIAIARSRFFLVQSGFDLA